MTHAGAVAAMVLSTLMWSIAGVVTRWLDSAQSFEVTFWRSAFNVLALLVLLSVLRGPRRVLASVRDGGRALWLSGLCWSVMFTAFMVALTLTSVANVLVTMSLGPLFTALASRLALGHRLAARTWVAIGLAGLGIAWMYAHELQGGQHLVGTLVALAVPVAAAVNWTLIQSLRGREAAPDMLPAVLVGAVISALVTLPLAWPLTASAHDVGLLALLGVVQLAIPCLISVVAARVLSAPEVSLLALLEVLFGVLLAWWGAGEAPTRAVLTGGVLVLGTLAVHELIGMRARRA
ncbi:MAG TPA: DMT family transporter [Burkholderiaceae bacterium]|nr:DMT family transporter [Burkholderiaceae bacterium]